MSFQREVALFARNAKQANDKTVRAITFALFAEVVDRTPVDTGRLKGNWQISQGSPATGEVSTTDASGATTKAAIAVGMGGWGSTTYLANNLPYAQRIEFDGYSRQAPAGMVRVSFARVNGIVESAIRQNRV
jgi:hypothetical protein